MKVLVVDPDETRRPLVSLALTAGGAEVAEAPSGSFALTMLEWNRQDVVVSRMQVADMDGVELCGFLRADETTRSIRFVLMPEPGEVSDEQLAAAGIDLVVPPDTVAAAIMPMLTKLVRADEDAAAPVAGPVVAPAPAAVVPSIESAARDGQAVSSTMPAPSKFVGIRVVTPAASAPAPAPLAGAHPGAKPTAAHPGAKPAAAAAPPSAPPSTTAEKPARAAAAIDIPARTFQGSLGVLEMEELVHAIASGGKTGRLLLVLGTGGGMIAFEQGAIIHAEFGKASGAKAFEALVTSAQREGSGKFCFIPGDGSALTSLPRTISASVDQLLLRIATTMDQRG